MNFAPYQWRFDGGYQPAEDTVPYFFPPSYRFAEPPLPLQPQQQQHQQHQWQPTTYVQGPVPVRAVFAHPPPHPHLPPTPPPPLPPPPPAPAPMHPTSSPPNANASTSIDRSFAPPSLRPGTNYFFPAGHTMVHVFNKASKVWQAKYAQQALDFKMFKIGTTLRVADIIRRVLRCDGAGEEGEEGGGGGKKKKKQKSKNKKAPKKGTKPKKNQSPSSSTSSTSSVGAEDGSPPPDPARGWAATEVLERGDGGWTKGVTVAYGTARANATLASLGWDERRGKSLPPVWVVVHKV